MATVSMTSVRMDEDVLSLFQEVVRRHAGKLKGAQSEAMNEAVLLWLAHKGEMNAISINVDGHEYVLTPKDFADRFQAALKAESLRCAVRFLGAGSSETFLVRVLDLAVERFGKPRAASVQEIETGKTVAQVELGQHECKDWVRKMYVLEDGVIGRIALKVTWKSVECQIEPEGFAHFSTIHTVKGFETFEVAGGTRGPSKRV